MRHPSNNDIDKLRELIIEMGIVLSRLSSDVDPNFIIENISQRKHSVSLLQEFVFGLSDEICSLSCGSWLKGVVNSALDTMSADECISDLKWYNQKNQA